MLRLTTYFGERDRNGGRFLAEALVEAHARHRIKVSALVRGAAGFGLHHHFHTDTLLTLSEDLPMLAVAVDSPERIQALLPEVERLQHTGLVTVERTELLGARPAPAQPAQLTLYLTGRRDYTAACEVLHRHGAAGATALLGVDGTVDGERRRATCAPAMVVAVGDGDALTAALAELPPCLATLDRIRIASLSVPTACGPSSPCTRTTTSFRGCAPTGFGARRCSAACWASATDSLRPATACCSSGATSRRSP